MKNYQNKEWLYQKYWVENTNMNQIASMFGINPTTVFYYMKKHGIKTKGRGELFPGQHGANWGRKISDETKEKMRKANQGRPVSESAREKIRQSHIGMKYGESTKAKLRALHGGEKSPMWKGGKIICRGYVLIRKKDHPRAKGRNRRAGFYVGEHVLVAEKMLGRYMERGEVVHHKDGNRQNNNPQNLIVLTNSEHIKLHRKAVRVEPEV
jgi:hypothetical protein